VELQYGAQPFVARARPYVELQYAAQPFVALQHVVMPAHRRAGFSVVRLR
jgi:hypothetical protein